MNVTCQACGAQYDDVYGWTYCPHDVFPMHTLAVRADGERKCCHTIEELEAWLAAGEVPMMDGQPRQEA